MNVVNKLTNEIIGAAIEVHRTLHKWASGASSMSFQHNLCDLRVLGGEYRKQFGPGELARQPFRALSVRPARGTEIDIPSLTTFGKPLLLGPGSIHDAHGDDEKIGKHQASDGVQLYRDVVKRLLEM